MPELPDITVYIAALRPRVVGRNLKRIAIRGPSLLRTVDPALESAEGRAVTAVERVGKRIVLELADDDEPLFLILHLMIAGRLLWKPADAKVTGKIDQAGFWFDPPSQDGGLLVLTEASPKKRASLHLLRGREALREFDLGGANPLAITAADLATLLRATNRTIKRALTDPRTLSGIGNAFSDEILHAARISPIRLTGSMDDDEFNRLAAAMHTTLTAWTDRLLAQFGIAVDAANPGPNSGATTDPGRFPKAGQITAFRPGFAVHGKYGQPCPVCGSTVRRIVRADNEINYCPGCQTGGRVLADRSLSRLLGDDWDQAMSE